MSWLFLCFPFTNFSVIVLPSLDYVGRYSNFQYLGYENSNHFSDSSVLTRWKLIFTFSKWFWSTLEVIQQLLASAELNGNKHKWCKRQVIDCTQAQEVQQSCPAIVTCTKGAQNISCPWSEIILHFKHLMLNSPYTSILTRFTSDHWFDLGE